MTFCSSLAPVALIVASSLSHSHAMPHVSYCNSTHWALWSHTGSSPLVPDPCQAAPTCSIPWAPGPVLASVPQAPLLYHGFHLISPPSPWSLHGSTYSLQPTELTRPQVLAELCALHDSKHRVPPVAYNHPYGYSQASS